MTLDHIDAIVDHQLANYPNRSGYNHHVNQPTCRWCGLDWHGRPETEATIAARATWIEPPDPDTSRVICHGSHQDRPAEMPVGEPAEHLKVLRWRKEGRNK